MKPNKIHYKIAVRNWSESYNETKLYEANEPLPAYELYAHFRRQYKNMSDDEKLSRSVELYKVNTALGEVHTIVCCGYGIMENFVTNPKLWEDLQSSFQ